MVVTSIFIRDAQFHILEDEINNKFIRQAPPPRVFVASRSVMNEVLGFWTRGALAAGEVPLRRDMAWLRREVLTDAREHWRVLAIDQSNDVSNVGSLVRTSAAFGITAVLLSHDSCDAWYRKAVRTSMGHCFNVPIVRVENLANALEMLSRECNLHNFAAVTGEGSVKLRDIASGSVAARWCLVLGSESAGVSPAVRSVCQTQLRIDMAPGIDSLSITVAGGIALNGLREREADGVEW
jgi:tRNA G18 (ribose-2'-O)-methylase SpoU